MNKICTDLDQSRKLAEFLPLESADMYWDYDYSIYTGEYKYYPMVMDDRFDDVCIPCWSLATLLSALDFPSLTQNKEDEWEVCVPNHKSDGYIEVSADNPVDACYEMILKLKEKNLL